MSALPPLLSSGVFYLSASNTIDAPISHVWSTLLDFPAYTDWNPFVRSQVITDSSGSPLPDQTIRPGVHISIKTHLPPTMEHVRSPTSVRGIVTVVDHDNYRVAWVYHGLPGWLLRTERWQTLSTVDGKTRYDSREVFGGIFAYIVKFFYRANLQRGFDAMGEALMRRAERAE